MSRPESQRIDRAYQRATSTVLVVSHAPPGLLLLTGADRLDLINRISTNAVLGLQPGAMRSTILTNALARVVDVITLFSKAEDVLLMTSPEREAAVEGWLRGFIFFQDDVQVSRFNLELHHWGIYGPEAPRHLKELNLLPPNLEVDAFHILGDARVWRVEKPYPGGYELLVSEPLHRSLLSKVDTLNQGAPDRELFEVLRIESGLPKYGAEITQETIPLEVGLWDQVSFEKGCYVGQEILARMESRGQLARRLVLLGFEGELTPGALIRNGERDVGHLTSVANSPRHGWIGLALVKAAALSSLELTAGENSITVRILDPLQSARVSKQG